ncbi:NAD(P)/FAD-dependent oxidoreductase [Mangrovimonas xylaniphaga]|uniref:NAD(P)/FAD-dependent oxidoreductase n=1 Tax=Mangrovimonas xylaniphaga TaxID=1645915 RepID=UPI0006B687E5|nr:FAD-dependent oxidoreductase [Mangrovimonas xylaniphaga]
MNWSFWEIQSWFSNVDFTIVGSGIVGLNCALHLKQNYPKAKVLVLEKGILPQGASTKNAGFACFGSLSEILEDLQSHDEETVFQLVQKRVEGLKLLRQNLSDTVIDFKQHGGYELFTQEQSALFDACLEQMESVNKLLHPLFKEDVFVLKENTFGFQNVQNKFLYTPFEGQIDTGKMMEALLCKVQSLGVKILNKVIVEGYSETSTGVVIKTKDFEVSTSKLFVATNGFASQLLNETVLPARAQVLVTKPIKNLPFQGTFHLDKGYYYFRNVGDRILFGGGRNLDFKTEETVQFGLTELVQNQLEDLLKNTILPNIPFEIENRWSGIMGVGSQKKPIVKQLSNHVFCGVRLGGMGVAIGSLIGSELAELLD